MKDSPKTMRLQTYLARCGIASRRECEEHIVAGKVQVNGETVSTLGTKVELHDTISFEGKITRPESHKQYVALHKPKGYLCAASDPYKRPLAIDLLRKRYNERLYNIGRLDFNSSGLILFTNDGDFARVVSHPSSNIEKEYVVESREPITKNILNDFKRGVTIEGIRYRIKDFRIPYERRIHLTLIEGKNREIRRFYESRGLHVTRIHRYRIGPIQLNLLKPGEFRDLKYREIEELNRSDNRRTK